MIELKCQHERLRDFAAGEDLYYLIKSPVQLIFYKFSNIKYCPLCGQKLPKFDYTINDWFKDFQKEGLENGQDQN